MMHTQPVKSSTHNKSFKPFNRFTQFKPFKPSEHTYTASNGAIEVLLR